MPSTETMWRSPVGAVDRNMRWHEENKFRIQEWKNIRAVLNPHDSSKDLCNVEHLRRSQAVSGQPATFMGDAALPGNFAMSEQAKENFNEVFPDSPKVDTPLKQATRREEEEEQTRLLQQRIEELEQQLKAKEERKQSIKEQRRQHMLRVREIGKQKRAEAKEKAEARE